MTHLKRILALCVGTTAMLMAIGCGGEESGPQPENSANQPSDTSAVRSGVAGGAETVEAKE